MARMTPEEWRKKKEEEKQGVVSSSSSTSSPSGTTTSGVSSGRMTPSEWKEKKASTSLEWWGKYGIGLLKEMQGKSKSWSYKDAHSDYSTKLSNLLAQADSWRKQYAGNDEAISYINSVVSALSDTKQRSGKIARYYSSWDTEDAYIKGASENVKARQQKHEDMLKRIEELKATKKRLSSTQASNNAAYQFGDTSMGFFIPATDPSYSSRIKDIDSQIEALEAEVKMYERGEGGWVSKVRDDYYGITEEDGFEVGSASRDYVNPTKEEFRVLDVMNDSSYWKWDEANGVMRDAFGNELAVDDTYTYYNPAAQKYQVEDKLSLYLNASEEERADGAYSEEYKDSAWGSYIKEGYNGAWEYLDENELEIYYRLREQSQETAYKYLRDMETELNRRRTLKNIGKWHTAYDEANALEKIALNAATIPAKFVSNISGTVENVINTVQGKDINPYSLAHEGMHYSQTVRGATAKELDATGFKIPVIDFTLGDIYQTGMSRLDSALATSIFGGGGTVFLGMGAAQEEAYNLYKQGASAEQITLGSFAAGAAEAIWENLSYGKLKEIQNVGSPGAWVKSILVQGFNEASEEALTEVSNIISNALIMGSQSDLAELYHENEESAFRTFVDLLKQTTHSAFGGFIGGIGAGATQATAAYADTMAQYRDTGKDIMSVDGGAKALKELSDKVAGVSEGKMKNTLTKQASKVSENVATGKGIGKVGAAIKNARNEANLGKLYNTVQTANNLANASANQADIAKSLQRKGFNAETASDIASALVAKYNGQELTKAQENLLKSVEGNKVVNDAISNIMDNVRSTMGQRSKDVRGFQNSLSKGLILNEIKEAVRKKTTDKQFTPTGKYEVSDSGKAIDTESGNEIDIKGVSSIGKGKLILELADGTTIDVNKVSFASSNDALIYEAIANLGDNISADDATKLISKYDGKGNAEAFARGIAQAYTHGFYGFDKSEMSLAGELTKEQVNFAYGLGEQYRSVKDQADKGKARALKAPGEKGVYYRDRNGIATDIRSYLKQDRRVLNEMQTTGIEFMEKMSQMMGVRFNVFETWEENGTRYYLDEDGVVQEGSPNGFYDKTTGEIYIDLYAGNDFQGTMLFTIAHELTHFMRQWSPESFTKISKIVFKHAGFKGNVEVLVADKMNGKRKYNYDTAVEEVVADAMETILKDGKVAEFMVDVKKTDSKLWAKLKEWFKNFAEFLKKMVDAYSGQSAQTVEGQKVADFSKKLLNQIEQIWAEGALSAADTYQVALENVGGEVDIDGDANKHLLSDKSIIEGAGLQFIPDEDGTHYKVLDANGKEVKEVTTKMIVDSPLGDLVTIAMENGFLGEGKKAIQAATKQYEFLADLVNMCIRYDGIAPIWETAGTMVFSSIKSNADKQYGLTIDFSTVCKKTQAIVDAMSEAMVRLGRGLTRSEVETIYLEVGKAGESTPCPVCYVFSRWMGIGGILDQINRFQEKYNGMSEAKIQSFIRDIKGRIEERANTPNSAGKLKADFFDKNGSIKEGKVISDLKAKAQAKAGSTLNAIAKNSDTQLQIQELEVLMENQDAKEAKKTAKKIEKLKAKLVDVSQLESQYKQYNDEIEEYEAYQWLTRTLMKEENGKWVKNEAFKPVPPEVLFDLNNGATFAEEYPLSWAFRTGKGASAGKAITPYADARVGEAIQGIASQDVKSIKTGIDLNPFLNGDKKARQDIVNKAIVKQARQNLIGGQRYQSTSDFRYEYGSDYLITFLEMQAIGAKVQLYTKVIEAVDFLASMGADVNLSVMPLSNGFVTLPNGQKKLIYSSVTGIDKDAALAKVHEYDNVQLILVGISDEHIRLALEGEDVTFVIPFHGSGNTVHQIQVLMNLLGENLDVTTAQDYTAVQSDHVSPKQTKEQKDMWNLRVKIITGKASTLSTGELALLEKNPFIKDLYRRFYIDESAEEYGISLGKDQAEQIFPYEYWDKSLTYAEADMNGERFKEYCASMGIIPRFSGKNSKGESVGFGDFTGDKGYWKLLIDRRMYDNTYDRDGNWTGYGKYHVQKRINCSDFQVKHLDPEYGSATYGDVMSKANDPKKTSAIVDRAIAQFENKGTMFSYRGTNKDGIEVYETSEATMNLTWADRVSQYEKMLSTDFIGRTARFERNGHIYYAQFDPDSAGKVLYGEKGISKAGKKAIIRAGADGDVFDLVENARYDHSAKDTKNHKAKDGFTDYFDYFYKTVQIDGKVFDININVKKQYGSKHGYTYTIKVADNKTMKASPALAVTQPSKVQGTPSGTNITQPAQVVNTNNLTPHSDRVTDKDTLAFLNEQLRNGEVTKVYRAMQAQPVDEDGNVIKATVLRVVSYSPLMVEAKTFGKNGKVAVYPAKLFSPMAGMVNGKWSKSIALNAWERTTYDFANAYTVIDEKTGMPKIDNDKKNASYGEVAYYYGLVKGGIDDAGKKLTDVPARYNPYIHTSLSALNDQFSSAEKRPELVTVECLVPNSELTSGERAEGAKDRVGAMSWHSGPTSSRLAKVGKARTVILTRYDMPVRVVPDTEVAKAVADYIGDTENIAIKGSTVTPSLSRELMNLGISVLNEEQWAKYDKDFPTKTFGKKKKSTTRYSDRDNAPTFYSQMAKVVDAVKQEKLGASSVVSMLRGKGVKAEEIKWSGIEEWLEGKKSVTKAELQEFIAGSMLQIGETMLDGNKGEQVKLPDNYRLEETANDSGDPILNLYIDDKLVDTFEQVFDGSISSTGDSDIWAMNEDDLTGQILSHYAGMSYDEAYGNGTKETKWDQYKLNGGNNYRELLFKMPGASHSNRAMEAHWGDRGFGILVHARVQDFNTFIGKMLFIEEIQSDWHNEGHAKGYESAEYKEAERVSDELFNEWQKVRRPFNKYIRSSEFNTDPEDVRKKKFDWLRGKVEAAEKKWQEAERYVESLRKKGAGVVPDAPFKDTYHEYVLKRLLRMAAEQDYDSIGWTTAQTQVERWSEEFAEGYRIEYDQDIPKFLSKLGKKWGTKVGKTVLDNGTEVWSMAITDSMKESVMTEGQPLYSDRILMGSLFSGGGTLEAGLVYQMLDKEFAVEYNKKIAATYTDNHGKEHMFVGDVQDFDSKDKQDVFYLHASPVCKNFSPASHSGGETTIDIVTAKATARVLEEQMPQVFTVENVKRYIGSEAYKIITDKLTELGYKWDVDVYKASDYGNATKRERMIIRAVKDGELPAKPAKVSGITSWGEATRDLWDTDLIPSTLVKSKIEAIRNTPGLKNLRLTKLDKPLMIYDTTKSKQITYAWADELAPTLTTKCGDARIIMPDGKVYEPTPKFMGRIQGLPDDYKYPKAKTNAFKIIGNGIPTQLTKAVIGGVLDSAYEQTHEGKVLYQDRADNSVSNRSLLANAFEGIAKPEELPKIQEYKAKIALIEEEEKKLREINAQIKELSFAKGPRDNKRIKALRFDAVQAANRINTYDKQLLRLEASEPLQKVLNREKKLAYKKAEERGKEALADYKAKVEAKQKETTEKWRESRKTAVAKARETAEKRDARAKLQKLVLDTVKWISYPAKTDVKCPDILKKPYEAFLQGIDLSSKRLANGGEATNNDLRLANAMDSLATAIDRVMLSQDPSQEVDKVLDIGYLDLPADFVQKLRDMTESIKSMMVEGEYVVNTMTAAEVRQLSQMIRTLNHAIKTMSNLYANLRFANVEALGFDTMDFLDAVGEIEKTGGMKDFVEWDNALPYYAFKRFGKGGESIFEGLMDAQDKLAFLAQGIFDFQEKTWTGEEAKAWSEDTHTITLPNGTELTLTTADAMSIYCLSRREQALPHLLGGGIRVMGIQKGSQKAKDSRSLLTIEDVSAIISSLTDRQKQVAEAMQEFMSTVCSDWGNEISMKRFLTREFTEKFYFPIESNDENLTVKDPAAQQSDLFRLLNISATKPLTQGANNEVIIRNIFDVFVGHASDMARLNAYGMGLLDYMKWLNYREKSTSEEGQIKVRGVRKSMEQAYGKAANSYVLNLIKDVNGRASDGGDPSILMKWMRAAKTASVGSSLRVATLQLTSYPRAALVLSPKSLSLGLTKKPNIEKAKKYCGVALWKSFGFYDTNISRSIEDQMKGVKDIKQKLIELSLKGAEWGDAITWGALWNACEYEVAQTTTNKVGSEEFYQEVGKKLREVVYRTQVVDSTLTRSQIMRSKRGMAQEAAAFMSEPTLSANILMDAGFEFGLEKRRTGNVKDAWKKTSSYIGKAVAVYSIGQLTAALLEAFWDAWRDDEDEEFWKKYLSAFGENIALDLVPFNKLPIVSDVFEGALSLFGVGFYSSDKMSTTWLTQAISAVDAWKKVFSGGSSTTVYNALYKTTRALSSSIGISVSGAMREAVALWNNTAGAYDSTLKIRQYDLANADLGVELYEAIMSGNTRQADSLKAQFDDVGAMHSAIRKALRENDPRIKEAASADYIDHNPSERVRIAKLIIADGFDQDDVVLAINSEIAEMKPDEGSSDPKAKGLYTADNFAREIANRDQASALEAKADIIATEQKNGKSEEDAVKKFNSSAKTALGKLFKSGELTEQEVITALTTFCDMEEDDAKKYVGGVAYEVEHPELDGVVSYSEYQRWEADGKPYGVSIEMFIDVAGFRDDGTSNSVKSQDEVALYISSVTSDRRLRHALWCCFYKASTSPWK